MRSKNLLRSVLIGLSLLGASPAFCQQMSDAARIAQMEATIRELNIQIATLLKENERLSNEMKSALSSQREGKRVVRGCDTSGAQRSVAFEGNAYSASVALGKWVSENGGSCSKQQLTEILNKASGWYTNMYMYRGSYEPKINYFLNQ